jgi:hypothetical protein
MTPRADLPPELAELAAQLAANERDAAELVAGLGQERGTWRPSPGAWSVAECLDHLATANRVYLAAMVPMALRARQRGRLRRGPALPGWVGGWFARSLEPPPKPMLRMKAPKKIRPRVGPPLAEASADFTREHAAAAAFLHEHADLDLAGIHFPNPFIPGVHFSLATGLHVIAAHERRHLWQAWRVRKASESAAAAGVPDGTAPR